MLAISSAQDFHAAVAAATEKPLVACFSAPWCGGCKLVAPKVEALAQELAESATFCKVGADELETLCEEVEVDSFPHFRMYKEGKILGDYTSSKFDKVDTFIRGLVAPDTVKKTEETPEGETPKEEEATEKEEGSKKRPEREEMASNDEQVAKKAKTEEEEVAETPKEDEKPVETEQVHTEAVENEATSEEAVEKEATSEEAVEKEATSEEAVEKEATSEEAVEKEETAPADADAAAA